MTLTSVMLATLELPVKHTGVNIGERFTETFREFEIHDKVKFSHHRQCLKQDISRQSRTN